MYHKVSIRIGKDTSMNCRAIAAPIVAVFLSSCGAPSNGPSTSAASNQPTQAASPSPAVTPAAQRIAPPDEWTKKVDTSAMDGDEVNVSKDYFFPDKQTLIKAIMVCKVKTKHLKISLESYTSASGRADAPSPFVKGSSYTGHPVLGGRIKFASQEPQLIYLSFDFDQYRNVISQDYNLLQSMFSGHQDVHGSGNLLRLLLPMVIEVSNTHGTIELTIPEKNDSINALIDSCSDPTGSVTASQNSVSGTKKPDANASVADSDSSVQSVSPSDAQTVGVSLNTTVRQGNASSSVTPSFDCAKASSSVEKLICDTPELATADSEMARVYKSAYGNAGPSAAQIKIAQRNFISNRNRCDTVDCIAGAYRTRLAELTQSSQ